MPAIACPADTTRRLVWSHGEATLNTLGAMLAPVEFRAPGAAPFQPMQVAPWADEPDAAARWPGLLGRLRGDWPCVPFGRCDRPNELPPGWTARTPHDGFGHGHAAHHDWHWLPDDDPLALALAIDLPPGDPLRRLERRVRAVDGEPALELTLAVHAREAVTWPVALHPTLRLDLGRCRLDVPHRGPGLGYPVPAEPGASRVAAGARFVSLAAVPLADGTRGDFTRFPQPADGEDLLQLMDVDGPVRLAFVDAGWTVALDWDRGLLPDVMLWVSHRGRAYPPWNGRHLALGIEPVNGPMDLGRVAAPPAAHPLASRPGLFLVPGAPTVIRARLSAAPSSGVA